MKLRTKSIIVTLVISIVSCNKNISLNAIDNTSSSVNVDVDESKYDWLYGKRFVQQTLKKIEPELGGSNFIEFQSNEIIELKQGDIVTMVKIKFNEDKIIVTDKQTGNKKTFTIVDNNFLEDEYQLKWIHIQ